MAKPGAYVPDETEGITRVEDLPKPEVVRRTRTSKRRRCPKCGRKAYRVRRVTRVLHDLGDPLTGFPRDLHVTYSQHRCLACDLYFNTDMDDLAPPKCHYTHRAVSMAVRLVVEDSLPYRAASWHLWRDHRLFVPFATIQNWVEAAGKKAGEHVEAAYLDAVLREFSGYIAADELYDGPFCILSIVDNRTYHRLIYDVLDHDPTHDDIRRFFRRFRALLLVRGLELKGLTTDGSPLYPVPIVEIFGNVAHQVCEFHVIAELTKAILKAVTKERRTLKAGMPKLGRGRPSSSGQRKASRLNKRLQQKITDLFDHRYLFVQHHLTPAEQKTLARITRGFPHLRVLRQIMDEIYRLFDRRCRTDTALAKLAKLRHRVSRFHKVGKTLDKVFSPNLAKALTFLDDDLLPATSNAVERGNRRYRKMQKSVYRVRSHKNIKQRVALDMLRDDPTRGRDQTTESLHRARAG